MGVHDCAGEAPRSVSFSVITVSETATETHDLSGMAISNLLKSAGHCLVRRTIVRHDVAEIQKALRESIEDSRVQAIVINGGTGIAREDVTIEAVSHFEEKSLPGFGELFRSLSYAEIGGSAMMSRATAFASEGKVVFCLPGSEEAVRLAADKLIAPELGHLVLEASR